MKRAWFALAIAAAMPLIAAGADPGARQILRHKLAQTQGEAGGPMAARYSRVTTREPSGAHYERALELYAGGPDNAAAILAELDQEIAAYPDSISARVYKARVLDVTDRCKEALAVLDEAHRLLEARQEIAGSEMFLKAECLHYEARDEESKRLIKAYGAFMRAAEDPGKVDELQADVDAALHATT